MTALTILAWIFAFAAVVYLDQRRMMGIADRQDRALVLVVCAVAVGVTLFWIGG